MLASSLEDFLMFYVYMGSFSHHKRFWFTRGNGGDQFSLTEYKGGDYLALGGESGGFYCDTIKILRPNNNRSKGFSFSYRSVPC